MPGRDVLWIGGLVALGIAVRGVYLLTPALDSDQAIVGLMARHILQGEFPIFFWGQAFAGTLEAHLAALLFYLLGPSRLSLALSPFLFSLAFLLLTYRLARESFGREAGLLALALAALPAPFLVSHSVTARANYIENLVFGSLILLLALRLPDDPGSRRPRHLVLLGFVAGLAWYQSPQSVHYLVAAALFLLLQAPRLGLDRAAWLVPPAFLVGSLPLWIYNLRAPASTFEAIYGQASTAGPADSLRRLVVDKLPYVLGAATREGGVTLSPGLVVLALYAVAVLYLLRGWRRPGPRLLLVFLVVTPTVVVVGYNQAGGIRYLLPLYSALPVVMAGFLAALRHRVPVLSILALAALLAIDLAGTVARAEVFDSAKLALYSGRVSRDARLFDALEGEGLTRVYVLDFWDAYRLTFDSQERVVFAEPVESFYPPYTRVVDAAERYAYVVRRRDVARAFEAGLTTAGGGYRRRELAGYTVFDAFVPPATPPLRPLASEAWRVTASRAAAEADRAVDRDPFSSWQPDVPPRAETSYQVDLGGVRTVAHVTWLPRRPAPRPVRSLRIETSFDGEGWQPISGTVAPWPGLAWVAGRLGVDASGRLHARLAPVPTRWLRLTVAGGDEAVEWSIRELFVSEVGPEPAAAGLEAFERGRERARAGQWTAALRAFQEAVDRAPEWEEAHVQLLAAAAQLRLDLDDAYERGLALERRGLVDLAARELWKAAQEFPHSHHSEPLRRFLRLDGVAGDPQRVEQARRRLAAFAPTERIQATFDGTLRLLGYTVDRREIEPGGQLRLSYFWECLRETRRDYTVFVHLRGDGVALGDDHVPLAGLHPTSRWRRGEVVREDRLISMPTDARPGPVTVTLGVWDPDRRQRLRVEGGTGRGDRVQVMELRVTAQRAGAGP